MHVDIQQNVECSCWREENSRQSSLPVCFFYGFVGQNWCQSPVWRRHAVGSTSSWMAWPPRVSFNLINTLPPIFFINEPSIFGLRKRWSWVIILLLLFFSSIPFHHLFPSIIHIFTLFSLSLLYPPDDGHWEWPKMSFLLIKSEKSSSFLSSLCCGLKLEWNFERLCGANFFLSFMSDCMEQLH